MSIDAMKMALEALWDCTVKLESQQFRNPVQIPPVYSDIIKAGYLAHAALRAAIEAAERQEPVACEHSWIDIPRSDNGRNIVMCFRCRALAFAGEEGKATAPQPAIPDEWTDPRPRFPMRSSVVLVLCEGGRKRYATHEYDGWRKFPGGILGRWSMADPEIIGWKRANWPPTTDEEKQAAGMLAAAPKPGEKE